MNPVKEISIFEILQENKTFKSNRIKEGSNIFLLSINSISAANNYDQMPDEHIKQTIFNPKGLNTEQMAEILIEAHENKNYKILNRQFRKHIKPFDGFTLLRKSRFTNQISLNFNQDFFIETTNEEFFIVDTIHGELQSYITEEEDCISIDFYLKCEYFSIMRNRNLNNQKYYLVRFEQDYPTFHKDFFKEGCYKIDNEGPFSFMIPETLMPFTPDKPSK